jgi:hypothetical protein
MKWKSNKSDIDDAKGDDLFFEDLYVAAETAFGSSLADVEASLIDEMNRDVDEDLEKVLAAEEDEQRSKEERLWMRF